MRPGQRWSTFARSKARTLTCATGSWCTAFSGATRGDAFRPLCVGCSPRRIRNEDALASCKSHPLAGWNGPPSAERLCHATLTIVFAGSLRAISCLTLEARSTVATTVPVVSRRDRCKF